jgi:hypothetical protein
MTRIDEKAFELDRAIDTILRGQAGSVPAHDGGELTATARLLRDALPRLHPRFGFEEHVAARLAAAARPAAESQPAPEPAPLRPALLVPAAVETEAAAAPAVVEHRRRGLVAGGAIASGVSLAGAAIVVWRRSRSGGLF